MSEYHQLPTSPEDSGFVPPTMRPRGIGDFGISEVAPDDGDDLTWDWWQVLNETGAVVDLARRDGATWGTMTDGNVAGVHYDVRTGPERLSFEVSARLYAFERQLALLQQRVATLEAELDQWRGD